MLNYRLPPPDAARLLRRSAFQRQFAMPRFRPFSAHAHAHKRPLPLMPPPAVQPPARRLCRIERHWRGVCTARHRRQVTKAEGRPKSRESFIRYLVYSASILFSARSVRIVAGLPRPHTVRHARQNTRPRHAFRRDRLPFFPQSFRIERARHASVARFPRRETPSGFPHAHGPQRRRHAHNMFYSSARTP